MQYDIKARLFPAIINTFSIVILYHFYLNKIISDLLNIVFNFQWAGDVTTSAVFVYLFMHIGRFIGKEVYEKIYFKNELYMPTTDFLLHSNSEYSDAYKSQVYQKILKDFNIKLATKKEENNNEKEARKKIIEAVSQIRVKVKDGYLLLQHNIEYGFWRNLIGGATVAFLISLLNLFIFYYIEFNYTAFVISLFLSIFYLVPLLLSRRIISIMGELYAKRLIQEYMSIK